MSPVEALDHRQSAKRARTSGHSLRIHAGSPNTICETQKAAVVVAQAKAFACRYTPPELLRSRRGQTALFGINKTRRLIPAEKAGLLESIVRYLMECAPFSCRPVAEIPDASTAPEIIGAPRLIRSVGRSRDARIIEARRTRKLL
ncbi:hypothetical protein NED98_00745 [Sphingomonas sp. MMSM20]|nr:hypothetical protein [Sphingomonas lycopersici]